MNWRLQKNPKGVRKLYLHVRASNIGVSKIQGVSRETYTLSMNDVSKNPKGFRENIYKNMTSIKISSSVHGATTLRLVLFMGKTGPMGDAHHVKVFEHGNLIIRESADFTLLIIGNPGALVSFFNYIPGLLFPKKTM